MSIADAKARDEFGKGGGLVGGALVREFPLPVRKVLAELGLFI